MALTDPAARFVYSNPYKTRGEIVNIALNLLKIIETTSYIQIRRFRIDNESPTSRILTYLGEKGIMVEHSVPHHHCKNGVAKRDFRREQD